MKLETKINPEVLYHNALPVGKFYHNVYGEINITEELVKQLAENFKKGYPHYKPPINISHNDENGAYGIIDDVEAMADGLWVRLKLTDEGAKLLEEKKFNYLSAEFTMNYTDPKTGKSVGPVLLGVALTNRPAHPEMQPINALSDVINSIKLAFSQVFKAILGSDDMVELAAMPTDDTSSWDWDWARDANAIIDKLGWSGLARACAYVKRENGKLPEKKENYKLPFAKLKNGKLTIYRSGVIAAMKALLGARGGVDIPAGEKKAVYNKLARLYRLFDMTPPEYHNEQEADIMEFEQAKEQIIELEDKVKKLEEENKKLTEEVLNYKLEAFKTKKVSEGYKPALIDKVVEMVKAGTIQLEAAEEIINMSDKVELEQKYTVSGNGDNKKSIADLAIEDLKALGYKKEA